VALWAALIAVTFGALDEVHQYFVPGRMASVTDALLNLAGAATTALVLTWRRS
jgi:VanZ family protein